MAVTKRKRTHKVSEGKVGARKNPLDAVQKVLLGKGAIQSESGIKCTPWRGATNVKVPYDAAQVAVNKRLYPHLFGITR